MDTITNCNENNYMLGLKITHIKGILQVKHSCGIMLITTTIILAIFWTINKQKIFSQLF